MLHSAGFTHSFAQPITRHRCIRHGFLRGEGFGRHQHQRTRRIKLGLHLCPGMAIHIRQIMPAQRCLICPQGTRDHGRAKIRPANADIEHIGKALTRGCKDAPFMHRPGEFFHARAH